MKITKNSEAIGNRPATNSNKKSFGVIAIVVITALLMVWTITIGLKAERTVKVAMLSEDIPKNTVITDSMLKPYDMLEGEYDKYTVVNEDGTTSRRVIKWDERSKIINSFAAYPLMKSKYAEYRDFISSRVENTDNVLYSFPGKDIVPLTISSSELQAFKAFLQPGDKLNIDVVYSEKSTSGTIGNNNTDVYKHENVFSDLMIADLLNSQGQSILDIYDTYRSKTTAEQVELDNSQTFKDSTEAKTLLVALTPEEKERYDFYMAKQNVTFKVSMPQRNK